MTTADTELLVAGARRAAVTVSVTVLDAAACSGETNTRKAYTALQLDAPTADLVDAVQPGGFFHTLPTSLDRPLLLNAGGLPAHRDGG